MDYIKKAAIEVITYVKSKGLEIRCMPVPQPAVASVLLD